ncbi:MAG: hypothetical protein JWR69_2586, partial [Pedosphaera sp.]|nr:hypothetical protein [Pedosphaera sp.]
MQLSEAEKQIVGRALKTDSTLGTFGSAMLMGWIILSLFLA